MLVQLSNSIAQLVEVLWSSTSNLLKIIGSTQEVISSRREWFQWVSHSGVLRISLLILFWICFWFELKRCKLWQELNSQAWGGIASYCLHCVRVFRRRCKFFCFAYSQQLVPRHLVALCSLYLQSIWFWVAKVCLTIDVFFKKIFIPYWIIFYQKVLVSYK